MSPLWSTARPYLAGVLLSGIPMIAVFWSSRFAALRRQHRAAGTLGASGWRIFWRVTFPALWVQICLGLLLVAASATLIVLAGT
jgi:ABC-type spermidine/putrescine transport system permease subunit II